MSEAIKSSLVSAASISCSSTSSKYTMSDGIRSATSSGMRCLLMSRRIILLVRRIRGLRGWISGLRIREDQERGGRPG